MKYKIGLFDSGIGGTTTLKEIRKILPNENYIYYADSKNNPYGEKTKKELNKIVHDNVNELLKYGVKLIVIACNTATTGYINILRKDYPNIIFVGVEPAIKVAIDKNYKNILLMATPRTIKSERLKELIKLYKKTKENIYLLACDGLANAIENNNKELIDKILNKDFKKYKDKNIDSIVLGCTHYPLIKKEIKKYFPKVKLIDGNKGVAKRVKYQLEENSLISKSNKKGTATIINNK